MKIKNKILTEEYITYTFETGIDDSEDFDFDLSNEQVKEVVDKFLRQEKQENRLSEILTDIIYSKDGKSIDYSVIKNMTDFFDTFRPDLFIDDEQSYLSTFYDTVSQDDIFEFIIDEKDPEWFFDEYDLTTLAEDMFYEEAREDFEEMKESERDPYYDYHSRGLSPSDFQ